MISDFGKRILTNLKTGLEKTPLVAFSAMGMAFVMQTAQGKIKPQYNLKDAVKGTAYASLVSVTAQTLAHGVQKIKNSYYKEPISQLDKIKTFGSKHFAKLCMASSIASIGSMIACKAQMRLDAKEKSYDS